eukprot:TRINITY_DN3525_c0_g2_i1.p1 TRINITY_DN3525_c0_g2~~TRINITY_DN3525_c0_g2_i1.p1  ORF type:complete len:336 (-),score=94.43 TRINITY_DN3525_c0_g2_i1:393-1400(-)
MAPKRDKGLDKKVECPELPDGWYAIEKVYASGKYAGGTYLRYYSPCGTHKALASVKAAIKQIALDNGEDPEEAAREYDRKKREEKEEEQARKEEQGLGLKGEKRERYANQFRELHGKLDGPTVAHLPGWSAEAKFLPDCGQYEARYIDPEGRIWKLITDIEAMFGKLDELGEKLPDFELARASIEYDENGKPIQTARKNVKDVSELHQAEKPEKKKRKYASTFEYEDCPSLKVMKFDPSDAKSLKKHAAFGLASKGDLDELVTKALKTQEFLETRGFAAKTPLVYVAKTAKIKEDDKEKAAKKEKFVDYLRGLYYQRPADYRELACRGVLEDRCG